jgi:hypothetical protein
MLGNYLPHPTFLLLAQSRTYLLLPPAVSK